MKKTTIILLILVLGIGGLVYYMNKDTSSSDDIYRVNNERDFGIRSKSDVHHIMIADNKGTVNKLDRVGKDWIINDKYVARKWSVDNLLNSIQNTQLRSIPTKSEEKYLLEAFKVNGVKVVLRDKENKIINSFIVGPNAVDGDASYFMKEGKSIYMMEVKNFKGSPRRVFQFEDIEYRSVDIVLNKNEDIREIIIDYPQFESESFALRKDGKGFDVDRLGDLPKASTKLNQKIARDYYREFDKIFGEAYFPEMPIADSLWSETPFATISMVRSDADTAHITLWPTPSIKNIKSIGQISSELGQESIPRFWVHTPEGDWMNMQVEPNLAILRGYSYFFE